MRVETRHASSVDTVDDQRPCRAVPDRAMPRLCDPGRPGSCAAPPPQWSGRGSCWHCRTPPSVGFPPTVKFGPLTRDHAGVTGPTEFTCGPATTVDGQGQLLALPHSPFSRLLADCKIWFPIRSTIGGRRRFSAPNRHRSTGQLFPSSQQDWKASRVRAEKFVWIFYSRLFSLARNSPGHIARFKGTYPVSDRFVPQFFPRLRIRAPPPSPLHRGDEAPSFLWCILCEHPVFS